MFITDEMMQATAYVMKTADNEEYYIEHQEHCDLCANSKGEWIGCGHYCFDLDNNIMYFKFWHQERWIEGKIFDYQWIMDALDGLKLAKNESKFDIFRKL